MEEFMKKFFYWTFMIIFIFSLNAEWLRETIGTNNPGYVGQIKIGNGRNDEINRIYVGCEHGPLVEWSYSGENWDVSVLGEATGGTGFYANNFYGISIADAMSAGTIKFMELMQMAIFTNLSM